MYSINMNTDPIKEVLLMTVYNCVQTTIINNRIIGGGVHTYSDKDFDELINVCGWTPIYNGVENEENGVYTQIRICE